MFLDSLTGNTQPRHHVGRFVELLEFAFKAIGVQAHAESAAKFKFAIALL
jgi:hypothetical protein